MAVIFLLNGMGMVPMVDSGRGYSTRVRTALVATTRRL
jgi:hypothetical protein